MMRRLLLIVIIIIIIIINDAQIIMTLSRIVVYEIAWITGGGDH